VVKLAGFPVIIYNPRRQVNATVAQLVEQTIRNRQVMGSNPIGGSTSSVVIPKEGKTILFSDKDQPPQVHSHCSLGRLIL
jgi:hypothetical protein